jgi:hypothetical protein
MNDRSTVDRVLEGLLELDFKDFMRVGSLRKISKRVIHHAPQADGILFRALRA